VITSSFNQSSESPAIRGFRNRREAGRLLADRLPAYADRVEVVVLALPRGGVPVAYEVANALHVSLDVFTVRKLGVPGHEELAMGAITSGCTVIDRRLVDALGLGRDAVAAVIKAELAELERRERIYRDRRPLPAMQGKTAIVVDDGIATGATLQAAVSALRRLGPARIVVAAPVGAPETCAALRRAADEVVCALTPDPFGAVGMYYDDFAQTSDDEVRALLAAAYRQAKLN
jgi:putative phosphoribosyl transferase